MTESKNSSQQLMTNTLADIIGKHIVNNGFEADAQFSRLVHAVGYLSTQLGMTVRDMPIDGQKDHQEWVDSILKATEEILCKSGNSYKPN